MRKTIVVCVTAIAMIVVSTIEGDVSVPCVNVPFCRRRGSICKPVRRGASRVSDESGGGHCQVIIMCHQGGAQRRSHFFQKFPKISKNFQKFNSKYL